MNGFSGNPLIDVVSVIGINMIPSERFEIIFDCFYSGF